MPCDGFVGFSSEAFALNFSTICASWLLCLFKRRSKCFFWRSARKWTKRRTSIKNALLCQFTEALSFRDFCWEFLQNCKQFNRRDIRRLSHLSVYVYWKLGFPVTAGKGYRRSKALNRTSTSEVRSANMKTVSRVLLVINNSHLELQNQSGCN